MTRSFARALFSTDCTNLVPLPRLNDVNAEIAVDFVRGSKSSNDGTRYEQEISYSSSPVVSASSSSVVFASLRTPVISCGAEQLEWKSSHVFIQQHQT